MNKMKQYWRSIKNPKLTKTEQYIKSLGCPIRKGTETMFIAIKGRGEKYGWNNVMLSKLSHKKFGVSLTQAMIIIKDFRSYGILQGDTPKKVVGEINKPNRYIIPKTVIKFFKKLNTVFKGIVDMNKKIFNKNQSITKDGIINILKKFNIAIPTIQEDEGNLDNGATLIRIEGKTIYEDKWYNAFDYIKIKTNRPVIEIANYYLRA